MGDLEKGEKTVTRVFDYDSSKKKTILFKERPTAAGPEVIGFLYLKKFLAEGYKTVEVTVKLAN